MKKWIVYFSMGAEHQDEQAEVYGMTVQQAVTNFIQGHAPVGAILAIIEKERTL